MIDKCELNHCEHVAYMNPDAVALGTLEFDAMFETIAGMSQLLNDIDQTAGTLQCGRLEEQRAEHPPGGGATSKKWFFPKRVTSGNVSGDKRTKRKRAERPPLVSVGPSGISGRFQNEYF